VAENIRFEGMQDLIDGLQDAAAQFDKIIIKELRPLGQFTEMLCKVELSDTRFTGELESSFVVEVSVNENAVRIFPQAKHAIFIRKGTRPHNAPINRIRAWAAGKLGDANLAWPVWRSIATEGTSVFQERKRGTKSNPWPTRVVSRNDFNLAVRAAEKKMVAGAIEVISRG
jgi:hypothetical protein